MTPFSDFPTTFMIPLIYSLFLSFANLYKDKAKFTMMPLSDFLENFIIPLNYSLFLSFANSYGDKPKFVN